MNSSYYGDMTPVKKIKSTVADMMLDDHILELVNKANLIHSLEVRSIVNDFKTLFTGEMKRMKDRLIKIDDNLIKINRRREFKTLTQISEQQEMESLREVVEAKLKNMKKEGACF